MQNVNKTQNELHIYIDNDILLVYDCMYLSYLYIGDET